MKTSKNKVEIFEINNLYGCQRFYYYENNY